MRSKTLLLQLLIGYWDLDGSQFVIDDESISFNMEDIYFLTGLSHRGLELNLYRGGLGDVSLTIQEYIATYYEAGTQKVALQIPIAHIEKLAPHSIAYCLVKVSGTASQCVISHPLFCYALECTQLTVFDWCTGLLAFACTQLTTCKRGRQKNFGYGSLIGSFFFERIPAHALRVSLPPSPLRGPQMKRWTLLWYHLGGGAPHHYDEDFFDWWNWVTFCVNEYYYAGVDYQ